ncbi:MAG: hypothetical protein IJG87_06510 [Ruminococcus sp.]|nr:hypothetical protein [Ruminococcus sp.]
MDRGHELTEDILKELEERVKAEYSRALADVEKKLAAWMKKFEEEDKRQQDLLRDGIISQKEYKDWAFRHKMMGKEWEMMRDGLAADFQRADQIALGITRDGMPDVYALNMNYGTYDLEHGGKIDTGFQLYDHDTAELLMRETDLQLMPRPSTAKATRIAENKDLQWNARHIQSAVLQGVLQGEGAYQVAKRLQSVAQMDYNNAVRYARTMTTAAQNAGRYQAFRRASRLGVDLTIEWQTTLDGRTRHDHRLMHGQRTTVDKPFHTPDGFKIMWPADCTSGSSDAPQSEIWNCRCTLLSWVKGFEGETIKSSPKMGDMSFEEWQQAKAVPNTAADRAQFKEYQRLLGKDAPRSYSEFQRIKYFDSTAWNNLKSLASKNRVVSSRNTAFGKPGAVIGGAPLNNRQNALLSYLQSNRDYVIIKKNEVSFRDMCALAAHEGVEFALLTRRGERMLIRGTTKSVDAINGITAKQYRDDGWRWSGHVHVVGGLVPSPFDIYIMKLFGQNQTTLFDVSGNWTIIRGR